MEFKDLPKTWRGINIQFKGKQNIGIDLTERYIIEFSKENFLYTAEFFIPKVENNRFSINGNNYIVWNRICKPICSIEYINGNKIVNIHSILTRPDRTDNYDIKFYIESKTKICEYQGSKYLIENTYLHDILYSYWLTNLDRKDLNEYIDSDSTENYITSEDIDKIFYILENEKEYTTNWKDIYSLRVVNLEDLIISVIMLSLSETLKEFYTGKIKSEILTKNIRAFLATDAPEIRLDIGETEIESYAQNSKILLPFDNYCSVEDLDPDISWYKYIDFLDSPQSIKVGSVASFCESVKIKDRKFIIEDL